MLIGLGLTAQPPPNGWPRFSATNDVTGKQSAPDEATGRIGGRVSLWFG